MNMIWSSFFNILPKPQYFLKLDIMFQWLKPYITWDRKKSHKWNKAFFILFLSLCVCLSCLRLCPPVLGFVVQDVQKGSPSRKNSLCLIAEGSVMIAAGFCPFEKLTEERHSMHLSPHLYVEVLQKGSQHVSLVHVCDCESAPEEKSILEKYSCFEVCSELSCCLIICWNVVSQHCGWLLPPTVLYPKPILPKYDPDRQRWPGQKRREGDLWQRSSSLLQL